jgi:hypothetical protein
MVFSGKNKEMKGKNKESSTTNKLPLDVTRPQ